MKEKGSFRIGVDIGSTTAKCVAVSDTGKIVFREYRRHNAKVTEAVSVMLGNLSGSIGEDAVCAPVFTGSAGYGVSESLSAPFVQEVVASATVIKKWYPSVKTLIDIGGEDSKMIFFSSHGAPDIRMNGSCAGGTGAFIDQIASLLGISPNELNELAKQHTRRYPIASRCGVFAKTDVQNLISRKVPLPDIAASSLQAVVTQTLNTLARGRDIEPNVLFVGGPLVFLSELTKFFVASLQLQPSQVVVSDDALYFPALGCAASDTSETRSLSQLIKAVKRSGKRQVTQGRLEPLFRNSQDAKEWISNRISVTVKRQSPASYGGTRCFVGIDSGSTTSKIAVIGEQKQLLFSFYENNNGDPVGTVQKGLLQFTQWWNKEREDSPQIVAAISTGYGEQLIKAAFGLNDGVVETIAHYTAARHLDSKVSFVLDIGGQDMKALFVQNGVINRIELNESCSSGCGSFIQTFSDTLGYSVSEFASLAVSAKHPTDLGTRCTVFMNSKVKQSLRENASIDDISAGLAISVVKNALFKVLKLRDMDALGDHIVVQGGTFRNPAVHRALEVLTGKKVAVSSVPELMGAYGAALIALERFKAAPVSSPLILSGRVVEHATRSIVCQGCPNNCTVTKFTFDQGRVFYSGNKCEKIFSNSGSQTEKGQDMVSYKYHLLFNRPACLPDVQPRARIGIPRALNMYENYPFWHAFLTQLGFEVVLSDVSTSSLYESGQGTIMSDNICFPAKLVHGHILSLIEKKVDRILYPMEFFQKNEFENSDNSFMCPVVSGYADVIRNSINPEQQYGIYLDSPVVNYRDSKLLLKSCVSLVKSYECNISMRKIRFAFRAAEDAQRAYRRSVERKGREIIADVMKNSDRKIAVVLAGRPYHSDPLVNHKLPEMIARMGVDILTEDAVPLAEHSDFSELRVLSQWSYPNRLYNAAQWVAEQGDEFQLIQITSFGCGPDAISVDEVAEILQNAGKTESVIKVDDINSVGSMKLRVRSMLESLRLKQKQERPTIVSRPSTAVFTEKDKGRTILGPHFSDFYSPFLPALLKLGGYKYVNLPPSSKQSVQYGLTYANNEICYPATVVVGDIIQALKSGKYSRDEVAVGITQTGGQCRASSYLSLIKKGMIAAGFADIPVIAVGTSGKTLNPQPGFNLNWKKLLPVTLAGILFADAMASLFYATVPRELTAGSAKKLLHRYHTAAVRLVERGDVSGIYRLLRAAVEDFNAVPIHNRLLPKIGIVGEIYIKYNEFGNNHLVDWLIKQGVEVSVPPLLDFFIQEFVNFETDKRHHLRRASISDFILFFMERYARFQIDKVNNIMSSSRFNVAGHSIFEMSEKAEKIVSLANQFGEGWLIPAEMASFAEDGIEQIVSLQPFGCIANHIISKGIEKRVKELYPDVNLLFLDFDNDISEVNVLNRLHFIVDAAKQHVESVN